LVAQKVRDYEPLESNIEDYVGRTVVIVDYNVDESGSFTTTDLILDNKDVIRTTSGIIAKQIKREAEKGLPMRAKIGTRASRSGLTYYELQPPE